MDKDNSIPDNLNEDNRCDELIDASLLQRGDIVRLVEGESVPADGTLLNGTLTVDESLLTGESAPIEKRVGDTLIGGSRVVTGSALMRVSECGDGSALGVIISSMQEAQYSKPPIQEYADVIAAVRNLWLFMITLSLLLLLSLTLDWFYLDDVSISSRL